MAEDDAVAVEFLPELGGEERGEGGDHLCEGLEGFDDDRRGDAAGVHRWFAGHNLVDKDHDGRNRSIKVPATAKVLCNFADSLMKGAKEANRFRTLSGSVFRDGLPVFCLRECGVFGGETVDAGEEAADTSDTIFLPIEVAVGRRGEESVHAGGVGTVTVDHKIG